MPGKPRNQVIDPQRTCFYHVFSRCVRREALLASMDDDRKWDLWRRLHLLQEVFAVDLINFAVMDNHLHLIVRLCPDQAAEWSAEEIARRWARLHPPRNKAWRPIDDIEGWIAHHVADPAWIERTRTKLASVSQMMKDLKQPIAAWANREDGVTGHFWAARFDAIGLEDEAAVIAACAYVDLNPFAAGLCQRPEEGPFTSLAERVESRRQVLADSLQSVEELSRLSDAPPVVRRPERHIWFVPIAFAGEDRPDPVFPAARLEDYLRMVDAAARRFREGKAALDASVEGILQRLHVPPDELMGAFDRFRAWLQRRGWLPKRIAIHPPSMASSGA